MTREERRRLLDVERKLAFGAELSALFAKWGYKRKAMGYVIIVPMEEGDLPHRFVIGQDGDLADQGRLGWDAAEVARERTLYEERVAKGKFDNEEDTDE